MADIDIKPVGIIHSYLQSREDTPRNFDISNEIGIIEIRPEYLEAMEKIEVGQTIVVLSWLHKARRDLLKVYPRGDQSRGLHGVFATRSPMRPNPIALSELQVMAVDGNKLKVSGVDVFDGTPILDIKKKL